MRAPILFAAGALACLGLAGHDRPARAVSASSSALHCAGAVRHPISVRVVPASDPVRGTILTASVAVSVDAAFDDVAVRLVDAGGTSVVGPAERALGALPAGGRASPDFSVEVPARGHRFLLQFEVSGVGPAGRMTRGATLNLLPDGPADPGLVIETADGRSLRSYGASARRIDR